MATLLTWQGNGLSNGPMTLSSSGPGDSSIGSLLGSGHSIATLMSRPPVIRLTQPSDDTCAVRWDLPDTQRVSGRLYFYISTLPESSTPMFRIASGTDRCIDFNVTSTGRLQIFDADNTMVAQSLSSMILSKNVYRLNFTVDITNQITVASLYRGERQEALFEIETPETAYTNHIDRFYLGNPSPQRTMPTIYWDDIVLTNESSPPPAVNPAPPGWEGLKWHGKDLTPGPLTSTSGGPGDTVPQVITGNVQIASHRDKNTIKLVKVEGTGIYLRWTHPILENGPYVGRLYFEAEGTLGSTHMILRVANAGTRVFDIILTSTGVLRIHDSANTSVATSPAGTIQSGTRYRFEWILSEDSKVVLRVFISETHEPVATLISNAAAVLPFPINQLYLGSTLNSGSFETQYWDTINLALSENELGPAYPAPVAVLTASSNDPEPKTSINLNGAGSYDEDGSITSSIWNQIQGPTVSLSGSGLSRNFVTPVLKTEANLGFQLVVIDNDNGTSLPSKVNVFVPPHLEWLGGNTPTHRQN